MNYNEFDSANDFNLFTTQMVKIAEGPYFASADTATNDDGTITFGYGYTFIRGGTYYGNTVTDLSRSHLKNASTK